MIPDQDLIILYASISRATTVLAHFSSNDHRHPNLETLATGCLQNVPAFHRIYSYSIQDKIHIFLIEDPFVYFAILLKDDDYRCKSRGIEFLGRLKDAFLASIATAGHGVDSLAQGCLDDDLRPVFQRLVRGDEDPHSIAVSDLTPFESLTRGSSVAEPRDSTPAESLTRRSSVPDPGDGAANENVKMPAQSGVAVSRDYSLSPSPKGGAIDDRGWQQARMLWRKHVRLVLLIDLVICCILFTVWMSICKGFRCVER